LGLSAILCIATLAGACAAEKPPGKSPDKPAKYPELDAAMPAPKGGPTMTAVNLFKQVSPSVYLIVAAKSEAALQSGKSVYEGSAVAITPTLALTNCHIIKGRRAVVLVQNKKMDAGIVVASDPRSDRCVIASQRMKLHPVSGVRPYSDVAVGEKTYSIGNPSGLVGTLGEGIVSGLREQRGVRYVQTSAPISPGSSGGGLFDEHGNLLGITTFKIDDAESLNFAIAAEDYWGKPKPKKHRSRAKTDDEK
jgi:S1-C subfamily serine protease